MVIRIPLHPKISKAVITGEQIAATNLRTGFTMTRKTEALRKLKVPLAKQAGLSCFRLLSMDRQAVGEVLLLQLDHLTA